MVTSLKSFGLSISSGAKKLKSKITEALDDDVIDHSNVDLKEIDIDYLVSIQDPLVRWEKSFPFYKVDVNFITGTIQTLPGTECSILDLSSTLV